MRVVSESRLAAVLAGLPHRPRVVAGGNFATPWQALAVLDEAVAEYRLFVLNGQAGLPDREGVVLETPFVGPGQRGRAGLRYFPCRLSLVPQLLNEVLVPDLVIVQTSPPVDGTVSLGIEVNVLPAAIEAARARGGLVVAQVNPQMPYTYGDAVLPVGEIDYAIEADRALAVPVRRERGPLARVIGERVAALVPEEATLQLGIGAVPDAVLESLRTRRGLGIWSEMFSDGVLSLEKAGALSSAHPITASFAFGSQELYDWLDRNQRVRMLRTEKTNDPGLIARQPRLVSVNSALQVDLFAQANAARVHGMIYSGFGGQTDFVVGAMHSPGGHAIIALPSWHPKADVSTVIPRLSGPVTSFQHSFIVSEQGTAAIWGRDAVSQAQQIVDRVAHPDARGELREAARDLGFPLR
ncbi:acetyl-CoA hydrolase/transferase family protein [Actinoallomurus rhizosphaericola]|uniref:acetyl-CoA hydrolase/transferase family protein n=1 Tax=Actinoallomurus rhizosphaericola TaxID=2952536 RepID=UPI00209243EB|nr:acetyl-CoA hydrolase/transferase C-terminal domain-containing protein [Actinoallomurus rhizosphaericola]MCO5997853.1 4-hydroxybutyrate CoA-transferase [Actinoallomurus rhizosphaericola]